MHQRNSLEDLEKILSSEAATALANIDYIVGLLNMKAAQNVESREKTQIITEILQEIKLIMTPPASQDLH